MMYTRQYISSSMCKHVKFQKVKKLVILAIAKRAACCIPDDRVGVNTRGNLFPNARCNNRIRHSSSVASQFKVSRNNVLKSTLTLTPSNELIHEFVFKNIDRWAQKTAMVCTVTDRSYTYLQLYDLSHKFATSLWKNKLRKGSTIAVILPNIPEYPIIILGAAMAGLKVTTINPISTAYEISRQLKNSGAQAVVTLPELNAVVQESISENSNIIMPVVLVDIFQDSLPDKTVRFSELVSDSVERFDKTKTNGTIEDTLFVPYSSGTTGLPKGVELSHRNIVANCRQIQTPGFNPANETTATHQEVVPVILPAFHIYGLVVVVMNYLSLGAKLAFLPKFNPEGALKCLLQYKSTLVYAAPPMILFFGNSPLVTARHLDSVKFVMSGAAPLGVSTIQRFLGKADHEIAFAQGWGLSETSPVITTSKNGLDNLDAAGFVVPSTELRVVGVDDHNAGKNVGFGESGELYVKGPQVMKGYYNNPEATANAMDGEWFKTGDIGFYSETGHVTIKDRIKELIKVKGFQVAPAELEELLRTNEDISDAGVIAEKHPDFGEIPKAFIVRRPGAKINADHVKKFVADRVAKYKQLGTVKFIDAIPKSAAGKILRRELKNL